MHSTAAVLERISSCVLHNMSPTGDHGSGRSFGLGCMLGHRQAACSPVTPYIPGLNVTSQGRRTGQPHGM